MAHHKKKRAIISLDIMKREVYDKFASLAQLQKLSYEQIWRHYAIIGQKVTSQTLKQVSIIEFYLLLRYLKENDFICRFWYKNPLFIHNDDLYIIRGKKVEKVDIQNLYFYTLRENCAHPFFAVLQILLEKNGGKLCKPNAITMINIGCMNKMYGYSKLYPQRKKYLQDLVIPYNISQRDYPVLLEFIEEKLGSKVVFKTDCLQEGRGVIYRDLSENKDDEVIVQALDKHLKSRRELIVTPYYTIKQEFRCYFIKSDEIEIFSIKSRENLTNFENLKSDDNIEINKTMKVKWHEITSVDDVYDFACQTAKDLLHMMEYDTGCIEFALCDDGKIVFFEVNQMAGPLPFDGDDLVRINSYYLKLFEQISH